MSELGLHKSGTNTNDATATASDILNEKTAYVKGVKVIGTQSLASLTADATATAADISGGATAYVKGAKVTGTLPAVSTAIQAPTVYTTDACGNFGLIPPSDVRMMPGSFLFHSAADVGAIPSNIVAGKSVLGVAGGVKDNRGQNYPTTVYPHDGANFGLYFPEEAVYSASNVLYANSAAVGLTPENIVAGKTILGMIGTGSNFVHGFFENSKSGITISVPELAGKSNVIITRVGAGANNFVNHNNFELISMVWDGVSTWVLEGTSDANVLYDFTPQWQYYPSGWEVRMREGSGDTYLSMDSKYFYVGW